MDEMERLLVEVDQRGRSNQKRLDRLESTTEAVQELAMSVKLMAQNIETMTKEMQDQGERLSALEKQPAERWNSMTRTIFTSLVSTLAGGLVGALVALII